MKKRSLPFAQLRARAVKLSLSLLILLVSASAFGQNSPAVRQYIERFRDIAIAEEIRTGVPAAITLAQGIHESSAGKSDLVTRSNNHFGIKCKTEWTGARVYHDDDARGECFRSYEAPEQSYRDHSDFLKNRSPYAALFRLDPTDFEGWAYGLKRAGYATNPKYPQILIKLIRDYNLQDYTLMALGRKPKPDADLAVRNGNGEAQYAAQVTTEPTVAPAKADRYPAGIFRINETPVIHVPKGTSLVAFAQQQGIALATLFDINDMKPKDVADRDLLMFLQRKKRAGASDLHVAQEGETLWEVAQSEGVQVSALLDYNGLSYNRAFVAGELIALSGKASRPEFTTPAKSTSATPAALPAASGAFFVHTVQPKETLFSLAKKYNVRVEDIQQWNNLPSSGLRVGQEVRIKKIVMTPIKLHDKTFDSYLSEDTIQSRIRELAAQIDRDYAGKRPLFIGILNGAFMFAADLFKNLTVEAEISFIKLASYSGTKSTGRVVTAIGLDQDLIGRDVIVVEDIVDTGKTLAEFLPQFRHNQPASLRIATLLHKPEATQFDLTLDYVGFAIPNKFVVGYGLDYDGIGRNLREIYQLSETPELSGNCSYLLPVPTGISLRKALSIALLLLLYEFATAQNNYFKGEVRDEQGTILQNVSILQAATGYFAYSGPDGTFGILSRVQKDSLVFTLDGYEKKALLADAAGYLKVMLRKAARTQVHQLSSRTPNLRFEQQQQWFNGDETYASTVENGFVAASSFPSTGLTLNIDRASYSNVRRLLNSKSLVPPEAVRIEELLNYFNFDYREPARGENFAIEPVLTTCPWNEANWLLLAQVRSRKLPLQHLPPSNLVFLVDVSASMDAPNRLPLLKAGFKGLVQNLRDVDTVSIVVYGGSVEIYLRPTGGDRKADIIRAIDALEPGGSTPGASGVKLAYDLAREHFLAKGNNRVILATDGDFNVGLRSETDLEDLITEERKSGVYLTCLGVGMGNYKDSKIQALAQKGNGNFAYIDNYNEAQKVLVKEFTGTLYSVGDDASFHVRFDPSVIKSYRLIGFDNKMGAMKDSSSALEGGEVGSGSSLLVAYEIEPLRPGAVPDHSMRFSLQYREPGAVLPCTDNVTPGLQLQPFAQLAKPYRFASAVILFGSLLKESRHVKEKLWNEILPLAQNSADPNDALQKEFVQLVEKAKAIYASRKRKKIAP